MRALLLLTAIVILWPTSSRGQSVGRQRDSLAVLAVVREIIAADNMSDLAGVLAWYADSALLLPPNAPPVRGRSAIRPRYERLFDEYNPAIEGQVDVVVLGGSWAYVRGRNLGRLRARRAGAADRLLNDAYTMLLARTGGEWRIAELAWHSMTPPGETELPVVTVSGPTVVAFWVVPAADSVLAANPDLAAALDDQQYYWSETRSQLEAAGIAAVDQPGRRFLIREAGREWVFAAQPDSSAIGYLLVRPGGPPRVLYRVHLPSDLLATARSAFGDTGRPR